MMPPESEQYSDVLLATLKDIQEDIRELSREDRTERAKLQAQIGALREDMAHWDQVIRQYIVDRDEQRDLEIHALKIQAVKILGVATGIAWALSMGTGKLLAFLRAG